MLNLVWTLSLIAGLTGAEAGVRAKVCVLNFLPTTDYRSHLIDSTFKNNLSVKVVRDAVPRDFRLCVEDGFEEIIIVAHSVSNPKTNKTTLSYRSPLTLEEKQIYLSEALKNLPESILELKKVRDQRLKALANEKGGVKLSDRELSLAELRLSGTERRVQQLKDLEQNPQKLEAQKVYSGRPTPIPSEVFRRTADSLKTARLAGSPLPLKKIRMTDCGEEELLRQTYKDLFDLETNEGIQIELAPVDKFWRFVLGRDIRFVKKNWLRMSLAPKVLSQ